MPPVTSKSSESSSNIRHERKPGVDLTLVNRLGLRELHVTMQPLPGERPANLLWRLDNLLREKLKNSTLAPYVEVLAEIAGDEEPIVQHYAIE